MVSFSLVGNQCIKNENEHVYTYVPIGDQHLISEDGKGRVRNHKLSNDTMNVQSEMKTFGHATSCLRDFDGISPESSNISAD